MRSIVRALRHEQSKLCAVRAASRLGAGPSRPHQLGWGAQPLDDGASTGARLPHGWAGTAALCEAAAPDDTLREAGGTDPGLSEEAEFCDADAKQGSLLRA